MSTFEQVTNLVRKKPSAAYKALGRKSIMELERGFSSLNKEQKIDAIALALGDDLWDDVKPHIIKLGHAGLNAITPMLGDMVQNAANYFFPDKSSGTNSSIANTNSNYSGLNIPVYNTELMPRPITYSEL